MWGWRKLHGDFAFGRLVQAFEAFFELLGFHFVENFQSHGAAGVGVGGPPDFGHAALSHAVLEQKALGDVGAFDAGLAAEQVFEEVHQNDPASENHRPFPRKR